MAWTFFEAPAALAPVLEGFRLLQAQTAGGTRALVPTHQRDAREINNFVDVYNAIKLDTPPGSLSRLHKITFYEPAGIVRFFEARVAPWSCIYFVDHPSSVCVALFSFYSRGGASRRQRILEHFALPNSVFVSSSFRLMERLVIYWLKTNKDITVP